VTDQDERVGTVESRWVWVRGRPMHYRASVDRTPADAPVVVLVHGMGVSSRYMVPTAERLAPHCRAYAPDLPGFGKGYKPRRALTLRELADALVDWMDAVGLERAALVANSFGCQLLADVAVRRPERVACAVLQGPTIDPAARSFGAQIGRWLLNTPGEAPSQGLILLRDYRDCGIPRLLRTFRYALEDRIEERLPLMRMPALVVRGARDRIVSQEWAQTVAELLPMGRLVVVPRAAHTLNYGAPRELARVVRGFLDGQRERHASTGCGV
jgi:2-hydroxy-6-oxonona-2,4-dienedioate hydrolase